MLVVGFTSGQEPIDGSTLVRKDFLQYAPDSDKPYSGVTVEYYENGQKYREVTLKDGKGDGFSTQWWESGQKMFEGTYKDGVLDGKSTWWHENGQKSYTSTLKDGKKDGLMTGWYENGQKKDEGTYKDGELISTKCWDEDGNEIDCSEL